MPAVPSGLRHGALPSRHRHNGTASSHTSSASTSSQGLASPAMSMRSLTSGTTAPPSPATTIERVPEHRTSMPSSPSLRSAGSGTGRRKSVTIAKMEGDSDSDDSVDHVPLAKITPVNRRQSLMPSAQAGMV
ncbi:hypothetical protein CAUPRSCDRAFT_13151 [Caulochytrium protostelioides]|nr:hypothetical protein CAUPRSCDRAFT_13151 [Caulochytrium protostelioides]